MFKPLEGVKVIDLTYFVAGPGAARILADWGADVIKVEPSFGDPGRGTGATMSCPTNKDCNPFYTAYNANKRGLSLNLKSEDGKAILDKMLETADVFGLAHYGTPVKPVVEHLERNIPVILEIDIQGARSVKQRAGELGIEVMTVFIAPPSFEELERRLIGRGTETPEQQAKRLETAKIELAAESEFDKVIVNNVVDEAADELWNLIATEFDL